MAEGIPGSPLVLVADDDDIAQHLAVRALDKAGCRVLRTGDGLETLRVIKRTEPALVLLDIGMPGLDGEAVCRILQSMGDAAPAVVFHTARTGDDAREHGLAMGAVDYITKPVPALELVERVRSALAALPVRD
jgi:DNA-binding response OmpR family regulator